jgi:hypothetical protein
MCVQRLKRALVGRPIPTSLDQHERHVREAGRLFAGPTYLFGQATDQLVTIILPEFIPARWWQHLLHNQTALLIKGALLFRKGVIVTDVPYHLEQ